MPVASYWPLPAPEVAAVLAGSPAPLLTEDDFLVLLQNLLPPGRAWPRDDDAVLTQLLRGFAKAQADAHARQVEALTDEFPSTAVELLPEWELTLGLPDPCAGPDASFAERQQHVVARIENTGGQSVPYLIEYAAKLGYSITITEFTPARIGSRIGCEIYNDAWAHNLQVNAPSTTITYARIGARMGDRLAEWGNAVLECEIRRVAPGQAYVNFAYH